MWFHPAVRGLGEPPKKFDWEFYSKLKNKNKNKKGGSDKLQANNIVSIKKQVVKGMNYDLTIELENGEIWNAIVYQDLTGELSFLNPPTIQE